MISGRSGRISSFAFEGARVEFDKLVKKAVAEKDVGPLVEKYHRISTPNCDNDVKTTVDQAFRKLLNESIVKGHDSRKLEQIIHQSIQAAERDACSGSLPLLLISDLFDCLTLDKCEQLFSLVEDRVDIWKKDFFFKHCKNQLLRSCNDLLRRLSRSQNTVFCGRILVFLARFFPLSERSGLNIISEFNLDNVTLFSNKDKVLNDQEKEDPIEDGEMKEIENIIAVDYNLYQKFWSLQDFFRQPTLCYNKLNWKHFSTYSSNVLAAFGSFKLDDVKSTKWKLPTTNGTNGDVGKPAYFAKYLTNQKLLELELSDSNFRRFTLIQFLILFQYLKSTVKFKPETFVLSEAQSTWINETTEFIYKLLEETPPEGAAFAKNVEHVLKREEYWNNWKNEGCPDFKKVDEINRSPVKQIRVKQKLGDELRAAAANKKVLLGNSEMNRLWNVCPDNSEACKSLKRDFVPALETFFVKAIDEMDPAKQIEEKEKCVSESHFGFRALRLLSQKSPHFFTQSNQPIGQIPRYLENMLSKLAKELPQNHSRSLQEDKPELAAGGDESEDELLHNTEETIARTDSAADGEISELVMKDCISTLAEELRGDWKQLAPKLNFQDTDISFFAGDTQDVVEQGRRMLTSWMEEKGSGATVAALRIALEKAGLTQSSTNT